MALSSKNKITDYVLKDCYKELKSDLNEEIIDELWMKNWIKTEEKSKIKSFRDPFERNEKFIDILSTK